MPEHHETDPLDEVQTPKSDRSRAQTGRLLVILAIRRIAEPKGLAHSQRPDTAT